MAVPVAELVCRTAFSFHEGASSPEELVDRAAELGLGAIAITDRDGVYALPRAHRHLQRLHLDDPDRPLPRLVCGALVTVAGGPGLALLARTVEGWSHLSRIITLARCGGELPEEVLPADPRAAGVPEGRPADPPVAASPHGRPGVRKGRARAPLDAILERAAGLDAILLGDWTPDRAARVAEAFGEHASLGLTRRLDGHDPERLARARHLGRATGLPLLATGDVLVHHPRRMPLQHVFTAIRLHTTVERAGRILEPNDARSLVAPDRFRRRFAEVPEAVERAWVVAERCRFGLDQLSWRYPREVVPAGHTPMSWLRELTRRGLAWRYPEGVPDRVRAQVDHELALIEKLDFPAYFLTVHDIVRFARDRGILCQGRGSAANSAVCFALGITAVDPASSNLLFERFISEERGEPPDIDVDFEHGRREEVIRYVYRRYGRHRAAMVDEVIRYRRRSAVRDVGRALGLSDDQVDRLARRLHWFDRGPITEAQLRDAGLDPADRRVRLAVWLAGEAEGLPRHVGVHVGGFTISDAPLVDLCPVEPATMDGRTVVQWDKDDLDIVGFVKVDILALGMLTAIRRAFDLVRAWTGRVLTLATVPPEDPAVYDMISRADTVGVFQIESRAQMSMLPRLRPRCWYDLVIETSIVRPGPIQGGMVHPYLRRRRGEEPVTYAHPALRPILERTLGVPIFQEQVMAMAVAVGGFTPGQADALRRAMGAWRKRGGLEELGRKLVEGMEAHGIDRDYAEQIAAQIQGFGEYGFPESHAASFARLIYVSAWLKHHHPAIFCAALLNSQPMGFYSPRALLADARRHGVEVRPVDVRASRWDCTLEPRGEPGEPAPGDPPRGDPALRVGLRLVKGLGEAAARAIERARDAAPFEGIGDFARRTGLDRDTLAVLARADAFRGFGLDRRQALWAVRGIHDLPLFRGLTRDEPPAPLPRPAPVDEVRADFEAMGFSVDHDPVAMIRPHLHRRGVRTVAAVTRAAPGELVEVAGIVSHRQRPGTANGMLFMTLEDETGMLNVAVKPRTFERQRAVILTHNLVRVRGRVQREGEALSLLALSFRPLRAPLDGRSTPRSRDFR